MAKSSRLFRAAFGSTAIIGCAIFGVTATSSAYAGTNFNKAQCKMINSNSSTKGLAIDGSFANACYCISKSGRRIPRPVTGAAGQDKCVGSLTPQKTVNLSLTPDVLDVPDVISDPEKGNNGWGNGGKDGTNNGSNNGLGIAQGGPGFGQGTQTASKSKDSPEGKHEGR